MTWFDELDEPTQQQWRARIAKGRIDLSASVEETLEDTSVEQEMWLDELDEVDGMNGVDAHVEQASPGTAIIPPRLSLQTKPMTVVAERSNVSASSVDSGDGAQAQSTSHSEQHTGVFARLAQRLTSSLAAITAPFQVPVSEPQPPAQEVSMPMPVHIPLSPRPDAGIQTVTTVRRVERSETTTTTTFIGASPVPSSAPVRMPSPQAQAQIPQIAQGKQRPAGYPTKVHLQAAPKGISSSSHPPVNAKAGGDATYPAHEDTEPLALRKSLLSPRPAPVTIELPTVVSPKSPNDGGGVQVPEKPLMFNEAISEMTTSGSLPTVHVPEKKAEDAAQPAQMVPVVPIVQAAQAVQAAHTSQLAAIFGSGSFEAGQGDVAIANQRITAASVVTVMLSSDPGPVVVQYVSLQPDIGFTIHLSAPTKTKTTFNYVVLQGEL